MILIVGSTGLVGSAVTTKLSAGGKPVTALVRDPASEKARALAAAGAKLVVGDLKDRSSLEKALAGVDTVICTASSTISRREGDSLDTVDNKGVQSLGRDGKRYRSARSSWRRTYAPAGPSNETRRRRSPLGPAPTVTPGAASGRRGPRTPTA